DVAIFDGSKRADHRAVIAAEPADVALVMRAGVPLYGDAALVSALAAGCDPVDICGVPKAVCAKSEVGKSYAVLAAANGSSYPAFFCGTPKNEPTCAPSRP